LQVVHPLIANGTLAVRSSEVATVGLPGILINEVLLVECTSVQSG